MSLVCGHCYLAARPDRYEPASTSWGTCEACTEDTYVHRISRPEMERVRSERTIATTGETVDLTPTWEGVYRIYLAVLGNPAASAEARRIAEDELHRMATLADRYVAYRALEAPNA